MRNRLQTPHLFLQKTWLEERSAAQNPSHTNLSMGTGNHVPFGYRASSVGSHPMSFNAITTQVINPVEVKLNSQCVDIGWKEQISRRGVKTSKSS